MSDLNNVVNISKLWTVFKNAEGEHVVHRDLDLHIARGEVLSLVGGSGTGKTVLLRQILGLEKPSKGTVEVLGQAPGELSAQGAANVGMLFQHGALFSAFSVLENIAFPLRELKLLPDELIRNAALVKLQMVGLQPRHANMSPADLSGGMIKRVALARALIMDPPLLLLDEPTAGLDPEQRLRFRELVSRLGEGRTVLLSTHQTEDVVALAQQVMVLHLGRLRFAGTPLELAGLARGHVWHSQERDPGAGCSERTTSIITTPMSWLAGEPCLHVGPLDHAEQPAFWTSDDRGPQPTAAKPLGQLG